MNRYKMEAEETVLIVIDLQEKLMKVMKDREMVVKNTLILLELANQFNMPVIVTEQYPAGLGRTLPEIAQKLGSHELIEKITFTALIPELSKKLQALNRKRILLVGSETHVCVFQTVRDLVQHGFTVYVPKDAVCSRYPLNNASGLELMKDVGAILTNTETAVFDILYQAGTPEFKVMSRLVK